MRTIQLYGRDIAIMVMLAAAAVIIGEGIWG